ncbi:response regulator [Lutibacter sp. A80]|uniref:two-component regulator propeller domain-containing protein n=1 Tax=Lutibacter sp. A80 TaxID=2918453 RepID=UPI001F05AB26|nr:two-component regulator propeller domain-containing protein [Lutibacter sp. A80]UMB60187.1 response regulator [Lutibacter sp. A80]
MKKSFLFLFNLLLFFTAFSQENSIDYIVDFIGINQGLSHNYVTSIISDDQNIKWIGTENGISKYNGYDFEYIKPSNKHLGLLNENIEVLYKDKSNNIWIGTKSGGISFLDIKKNRIEHLNYLINIEPDKNLRITAICEDSKGYIWLGTWENGVFVIDYKNNKLIKRFPSKSTVYDIEKDAYNNMWFTRYKKLIKYDPSEDRTISYQTTGLITNLLADKIRDKVWISINNGKTKLYSFNYNKQAIDSIETGVSSNFTKKLLLDRKNRLWIGTWGNGLYRSNIDLTEFSKVDLVLNHSDKMEVNYQTILNIHEDQNHLIWVSTANGGILKLTEGNGFNNASSFLENGKNYNINSIYKNDKDLFLGTEASGLYFGKDYESLQIIKGVDNSKIRSIYEHNKKLYIGTSEGFYILDVDTKKVLFSNKSIKKITAFHIDTSNNLYLGTQQNGLCIVSLNNLEKPNAYTFYSDNLTGNYKIHSDRISSIKQDSKGNIWVGTYNGIHVFKKGSEKFMHHSFLLKEALPKIVNSITINQDDLWVSTPRGLYQLSFQNNKLAILDKLDKNDGLNSDFICASTFDSLGNVWISTISEIVKYNAKDKILINYNNLNNVYTSAFNKNTFFNYNNELILFGGNDNVTFFNPKNVINSDISPEVIYMTLKVNNNLIEYHSDSKILNQSFCYTDNITLTHKDKFFSISFVANDYLGASSIMYRYKLETYQKDWINLGHQNEVNFTGLPPGKYKLKVQASRDGKNWSTPKVMSINLLNSPWLEPWAVLIYFTIFCGILIFLVKAKNDRLKLKNNLEIARIDKEKEMELSETKSNFFTNISHEFRTPLTLIITPLTELLNSKDLPYNILKKLSLIDRNANRLLDLINQLLDFRKAEYGLLKLNVSYGNFVRFTSEVHLYFKQLAKSKNIKYVFKTTVDEIFFPFDRNKMEIVLCNLISNAIKYCNEEDEVIITLSKDDNYCIISIKDTGIGIDEENLGKIFDRFFQIKSANTTRMIGSGIGLAFSKKIIELHHGSIEVSSKKNIETEFIIKLSLTPELYKGEINEKFVNTDNIKAYNIQKPSKITKANTDDNKKYTILIIDDNFEILSYLNDILEDTYTVIKADNGTTGFEIASTEIPDLIVSDVMMPGKDGITLCKEIKSQIITSHIPIILLTARTSSVFEIKGLKTGADDYITKPFNTTVVKARIAGLLENREKLRTHLKNKIRFEPTASIETVKNADTENAFIHKAILLVEDNLQNSNFGIDNMVDELNMSQSTLYRKIKSLTGLSLTAFIRSIRLKKAANLIMVVEEMNLNQIAYEVGFNDYKYFKISFEKQFNCLPSKYKELVKKEK